MLQPPVHDPVALGEKAVSAEIDAVAAIVHGAGDAANLIAHLNHNGANIGAGKQFVGGGEPGRPGADDDGSSSAFPHRIPTESAAADGRGGVTAAPEAGCRLWLGLGFGLAWESDSKTARSKASLKGALMRS